VVKQLSEKLINPQNLVAQLKETIETHYVGTGALHASLTVKEVTQAFFDVSNVSHKYHEAQAKVTGQMVGRLFNYFLQYA
jgi:hypothetical protein